MRLATRRSILLSCIFVFAIALLYGAIDRTIASGGPQSDERAAEIDVLFSPDGGCARRIISEIEGARKTIRVQAYLFTSNKIAKALVDAQERGVDVTVIFDASQKKQRYAKWKQLKQGGVTIKFDDEHATANSKTMLIDNTTIITGSYNYTQAAETKNSENIVVIKNDRQLFAKFLKNFEEHLEHAE